MELNKSNIKKLILIIFSTIIFTFLLFNFDKVMAVFLWIIRLLMPFIIGFCAAFIINVPMRAFERILFKNKNSRLYRFKRPVCIILTLLCIIAVLTFVITMLIPEVSDTIVVVGEKIPNLVKNIQERATGLQDDYPKIVEWINNIDVNWDDLTEKVFNVVKNGGTSILSSTFSIATSVVGGIIDFVVGIFFAIYILAQKENLERQTKGLIYAVMKEKVADKLIKICGMADQTFSNFISGQCLEACILGLMFFVSMSLLKIPYALTVSITITITALIPVFGSFLGCGIGAFLILVDNPHKVIVFLILFIILQQIEGNLIYPHVVGGSVGLPSIWVLVAVVVGGDLMGIIGMLIFVPITSVAYAIVKEYVLQILQAKKIAPEKYGGNIDIPEEKFREKRRRKLKRVDKKADKSKPLSDKNN